MRDGGGIVPDIKSADERKMNIAYYIYVQNSYFDFANQYVAQHQSIAKPSEFTLSDTDFQSFKEYLVAKKFTYKTESEKMFAEFQDLVKSEGIDKYTSEELKALELKLKPDVMRNVDDNKADIVELLSLEIIKRYYFQKGEIEYALRFDNELKSAIENLTDKSLYDNLLSFK